MNYVVVNTDTLQIVRFDVRIDYDLLRFLGLDPEINIFVEIPEGLDPERIMAIRSETGEITLVQDPLKVQAKLDQAWTALRTERNARLAASDWTQLVDAHLSQDKKDAWAAYRQELRDLPEELAASGSAPTDPFEWPLRPGELPPPPPVTSSRLGALLEHAGVEVVQEPVTVPEEPVTVPEEPVSVPEEPVTVPEEPVSVPEEPVTVPEEPVTVPEVI